MFYDDNRLDINKFFEELNKPTWVQNVSSLVKPAKSSREIIDSGTEYKLMLDLPGFQKSEVSVRADEDRVLVVAKNATRAVEREYLLPQDVSVEKIEATLSCGVLKVRLPKKQTLRSIEVK